MKFWISLATIALFSFVSYAQESAQFPKVNIISPTASALAKYVDFPVNHHTGIPEISIPIYTLSEGPLELPIALSYHASGLTVLEPASWVGAGWSLNAGGIISRTVRGVADEQVVEQDWSHYGYNGFSNYFLDEEGLIDFGRFVQGKKDGEPDLFTYSFGGFSGKFYFREDLTTVLIPEADVKIEPITKPGQSSFGTLDYIQGFKATTPDGIKYFFGVTPGTSDVDAVEKSRAGSIINWPSYPKVISSWYLYKVETADSQFSINLSYRKEEYGYYTIVTKPCLPVCDYSVLAAKILIEGVALDKIEFSNGSIEFIANHVRQDLAGKAGHLLQEDANTEAKALQIIKINSNRSEFCKSFVFSYDYFYDSSTDPLPYVLTQPNLNFSSDRKRLKLLSVRETSCDETLSLPSFEFQYYDEIAVPRRLSLGQDHWGFNNGRRTNANLIPPVSINGGSSYYPGDDRDSRWPDMRAGALRLIRYPTGGIAEYTYEPNSVTTASGCSFSATSSVVATLSAGMGTGSANFGLPHTLVVTTPTPYFYRLQGINGGSGALQIDNSIISSVAVPNGIKEDYLLLSPGTYSIRAYANADNGSGIGVLVTIYAATSQCPPGKEKLVGGLRIKQVSKSAGTASPKLAVSYEYADANLYSIPVYVFKLRNEIFKLGWRVVSNGTAEGCIKNNPNLPAHRTFYSPSSLQPLQSVQGYHIGYRKVKEMRADGGYNLYEFNGNLSLPPGWYTLEDVSVNKIDANVCRNDDPIFPSAPLPFDFQRGKKRLQQVFDNNSNKLTETLFSEEFSDQPVGAFGFATAAHPDGAPFLVTNYQLRTAKRNWSKEVHRIFDFNGTVNQSEVMTTFNSPFHNMPTSRAKLSTSSTAKTEYRYVPDLTTCDFTCPSCVDNYVAATISLLTEYLVKDGDCKNNICSNANFVGWRNSEVDRPCYILQGELVNCRKAAWTDYQFRLNLARITYTNCIKSCKQNNNCIVTGISNSSNESLKALFLLQQQNQLQLIEMVSWRDEIFQSAQFFDYQPTPGDATKVYLKNGFGTEVQGGTSSFAPSFVTSGVIQKDIKYREDPIAVFQHRGGQPAQIKDQTGITTSFIWGFNNTVPVVKATGVDHTSLLNAYNASPTNFRSNPGLTGAHITTYTHDPVVGISSTTDANGVTLLYEYDKLGRVIKVKDNNGHILEQYEYSYRIN